MNKYKILMIMLGVFLFMAPKGLNHGEFAKAWADELSPDQQQDLQAPLTYPYTDTFIISAYYSPLPCQNRYVTGSYASDIRLNGGGVHGADGTSVYPGMIAAPRGYDFGIKMYIPGVGITAVHDRGGAIVHANERGNSYDRLDIWMGYGDKGLERALKWGKRTVDVTVYGKTDSVIEDVNLLGYVETERVANQCGSDTQQYVQNDQESATVATITNENENFVSYSLSLGSKGSAVSSLQEELKKINFLSTGPTGEFDELTAHAVFKFQQSQNLIENSDDQGAGVFGPKTKARLNEIVNGRKVTLAMIDAATSKVNGNYVAASKSTSDAVVVSNKELITMDMDLGLVSDEVKKLQIFLKDKGYFTETFVSNYFGLATRKALLKFQLANNIVLSEKDKGAGRVGPSTRNLINELS